MAKQAKRARRKGATETAATGLPKTFAGMKVPKTLRNSSMISAFINNPLGREVLAAALLAGATAAAAALLATPAARRSVGRARKAVAAVTSEAAEAGGALTEGMGNAAKQMLPQFLGGESKPGRRGRAAARSAKQPRATRTAGTPRKPRTRRVAATAPRTRRTRRNAADTSAPTPAADMSKTTSE